MKRNVQQETVGEDGSSKWMKYCQNKLIFASVR